MGVGEIFAIISAIIAAASAIQAGQQQRRAARTQEKIAENNATVAGYEANEARAATELKVKQHRLQVAQILGKQRAAMGATGVVVDEGTFLDLTLDTVSQGKLDELALMHEGDLDAWRAEVSGSNAAAQSALFRASAPTGGEVAASALMTGAGTGLGYYSMFRKG